MSGVEDTSTGAAAWSAAGTPAPAANAPPRGRLFRKYALLFIALVGVALLVTSGFDFWFSYQENKAALVRVQQEKAQAAAARIEEFVGEIERQIGWTTHAQWAAAPLDQRRQDYFRLLRQVPAITELSQLDAQGKEQLKVSRLSMDVIGSAADFSQTPAFKEAKAHRVWFSPVYFRKESEPYMTLAIARDGRNAGVTIAEINLKLIWDVITAMKIGQQGYAYVVDGGGRLVAHPDISLVLRDTDLAQLPQVAAALAAAPTLPSPASGGGLGRGPAATVAQNLAGRAVLTAHAAIQPLGWLVFVEVPLKEAFAPLYGAAIRTALLLVFGLTAAALVALVLARRMTGPIRAIAAGAERLGAGELDRRIEVHTGDELEALAGQFNRMAGDLQKSYAELEQRVRDRTAELSEALDQQTATAEVLGVINASPGDLAPVFDAMLEKAHSLCEITTGALEVWDGKHVRALATRGLPAAFEELIRQGYEPGPNDPHWALVNGDRFVHVPNMAEIDDPTFRAAAGIGLGTFLAVALRKDNQLLGRIVAARAEVRPFSEKEIALLQNFAAQAVIAMENARLITETREALEQQTATAEVLGIINSSPGDLAPVFDAMLEKALALCNAAFGSLWSYEGKVFRGVAQRNLPSELAQLGSQLRVQEGSLLHRLIDGENLIEIEDITASALPSSLGGRAALTAAGARAMLWVALRREDTLVGAINIYRTEVRAFTDKQIALLQNFAAQAVIAMENARLLTETREALEQQTATAEVLGVINSSPGDLAPVFEAMLEKAISLCDAVFGQLSTYDGDQFHRAAIRGDPAYAAWLRERGPFPATPGTPLGCLVAGESVFHVADALDEEGYRTNERYREMIDAAGVRSMVSVALRKDGAILGGLTVYRREVRPFTDKQIALLQNFAAQAVIAMENARLITETREALEQQTATAEVLGVINSSPGDLAPVFDAILEKAHSLCGATQGGLLIRDGNAFRIATVHGDEAFATAWREMGLLQPPPGSPLERVLRGERVVQVANALEDEFLYRNAPPPLRRLQEIGNIRTLLIVPLAGDDRLLGAITAFRQEVRPFSDREIALLQNFAAQAVIAMENARLMTETREALEQQTATAEVLGVINSSPGDLAPVFDAILEKAHSLCGASFGGLVIRDGDFFRAVALRGAPEALSEVVRQGFRPLPDSPVGQLLRGEPFIQEPDVAELAARTPDGPIPRALFELAGVRTQLLVPLRKDDALLGFITAYRQEVRPFTDKQIALLQNFAAQAVIAMENARLITETREALDQQTATAEVLGVINSSPGDLAPVFDAMLQKATVLCGAAFGTLVTFDGERFLPAAAHCLPPAFAARREERGAFPAAPGSSLDRVRTGETLVHIADVAADPGQAATPLVELGGCRSLLCVALRKDDKLLGAITAYRQEPQPFTDKQIALLQNFAAQAVIAIENARLLGELRERTDELGRSVEELKALSEVGQAVSSTLELRDVLSTILNRSVTLAGADAGAIFRYRRADRTFRFVEAVGYNEAMVRDQRALDVGENITGLGIAIANRAPLQIPDLRERPPNPLRDQAVAAGYRSVLIVPLVGADRIMGATVLQRRVVGEFPEATVRLMQTLAAQSVLAIQNALLFREIAEKSEELRQASLHKSQFLANMSHELRTPLNAILGYAELLADGIYGELAPRATGVLERVQNNGKHLLALINDVLDLSKIEAGQLVLTFEDYALPDVVHSVVSATESLANSKGLKFTADIAPGLPPGHGDARRLAQVLLNLTGNAIKFTDTGEVAIAAAAEDGHFVMTVRDTGPGIAAADHDKIFGEFQQVDNSNTRKKGGTGLGLAISKRMVEMQGGTISVESELGHGATFRVTLPIRVENAAEELLGAAQ